MLSFSTADFAIVDGAFVVACPGSTAAGILGAQAEVMLELTASGWRGRPSTPAGGSFEARFFSGPLRSGGPGGGPGIAGSVSGTMTNEGHLPPPLNEARLLAGGAAIALSGGVSRDGLIASGTVTGEVQFSNGRGEIVTCNPGTVTWSLSRLSLF